MEMGMGMGMGDQRRRGDSRPFRNSTDAPLDHWIDHENPFRWFPKHGDPFSIVEKVVQMIARLLVFLPVYVAIVVTIMLVLVWRLS